MESPWQDLSDDELYQRLERAYAGDKAMARGLVEKREQDNVARTISSALTFGVFGIDGDGRLARLAEGE